jgi:hypothetical protein
VGAIAFEVSFKAEGGASSKSDSISEVPLLAIGVSLFVAVRLEG